MREFRPYLDALYADLLCSVCAVLIVGIVLLWCWSVDNVVKLIGGM